MSEKMPIPYRGTVTIEDFDKNKKTINLGDMILDDHYNDPDEVGTRYIYKAVLFSLSGEPTLYFDVIRSHDGGFRRLIDPYVISSAGVDSDLYTIVSDIF